MEVIRQTATIPATRNITIQLPDTAAINEEVEIIILFKSARKKGYAEKIAELREVANDPLFQEDLREIAEDFRRGTGKPVLGGR
ncbi:MAG: hypothetical protein AB1489_05175 [Acidobacteriota bacterium]